MNEITELGNFLAKEMTDKFGAPKAATIMQSALVTILCSAPEIHTMTQALDFWRLQSQHMEALIRVSYGSIHYG